MLFVCFVALLLTNSFLFICRIESGAGGNGDGNCRIVVMVKAAFAVASVVLASAVVVAAFGCKGLSWNLPLQ